MIAIPCRRCGSTTIQKNGRTSTGQQKYHCRSCHFYGTLVTKEHERALKYAQVMKLHLERVSQRGITRVTGVTRPTIIKWLKKKDV